MVVALLLTGTSVGLMGSIRFLVLKQGGRTRCGSWKMSSALVTTNAARVRLVSMSVFGTQEVDAASTTWVMNLGRRLKVTNIMYSLVVFTCGRWSVTVIPSRRLFRHPRALLITRSCSKAPRTRGLLLQNLARQSHFCVLTQSQSPTLTFN